MHYYDYNHVRRLYSQLQCPQKQPQTREQTITTAKSHLFACVSYKRYWIVLVKPVSNADVDFCHNYDS
jgi:hypothetical protein